MQLRNLDLERSGPIYLTATDLSVLGSLPSLTTLWLEKPDDLDQHAWDERVAQLQAACTAQGHTPPAVKLCGTFRSGVPALFLEAD